MARGQPAAAVEPSGRPKGRSPAAGSALAAQPAWGAIVIWMAVLAFMVSCTGCALLVRWAGRSSTSSYGYDKPQRFHIGEVPRLGGVPMYLGLAVSWGVGTWLSMRDRKSTRLNSSHTVISYAVFCLKKKNTACSVLPSCVLRDSWPS